MWILVDGEVFEKEFKRADQIKHYIVQVPERVGAGLTVDMIEQLAIQMKGLYDETQALIDEIKEMLRVKYGVLVAADDQEVII